MCRCWLLPHSELCRLLCEAAVTHRRTKRLSSPIRREIGHRGFPRDAPDACIIHDLRGHVRALFMWTFMYTNATIRWARMMTWSATTCDVEMEIQIFRHQYFSMSANCLQDMCCIIESELLAVWSMSWVILIDRRNSFSRQKDERSCRRGFILSGRP